MMILALLAASGLAACYGGPATQAGPPASSTSAGNALQIAVGPLLPDVPIDIALKPVDLANPSAAAKAAIDLCVRPDDMNAIAGMALLASARDVKKYMLTNGKEPELLDDVPVWMVQFRGAIHYRWGTPFNPVCVAKDGVATIYVPYGSAESPGWSPPPDFVGPQFALPPPAK